MGHNIEVTVTRSDRATVEVSKRQVLNLAKIEISSVLNSFASAARQEYLRELAASRNQKYSDPVRADFSTKAYGETITLYEVDGDYDYHNDYYSDKRISDLSLTEADHLEEFDQRLEQAVTLLGGVYAG